MTLPITTHVYGDYWRADGSLSELGTLIRRQQDRVDLESLADLVGLLVDWFTALKLPQGAAVVAVPANPERRRDAGAIGASADHSGACSAVELLAQGLAAAAGLAFEGSWLTRSAGGPRVRDVCEQQRHEAVRRAGYAADPAVRGRHLVLVDDVVLTGTTTRHLAGLALMAGAASVTVAVAARTRRAL